jgi:pSer/pThr/pTyr-binding forkhead associated (FHA) protein
MVTLEEDATVGRAPENRIALDDAGASRKHAALRRTSDGGWEIEDLRSGNGTLVNDVRIAAPTLLKTGDRIRISRCILRVERAPAPVGRR